MGTVTLEDGSSVSGNTAGTWDPQSGQGGGIGNSGTMTAEAGSVVSGNTAGARGGGIITSVGGTVTLEAADIVTGTYLMDGAAVSNCSPVNTIANGIG